MNAQLLHTNIQDFIDQNLHSDLSRLILKGSPFKTLSIQEIVEQIESKNRARSKLPTWFNTKAIYYPNKLNISQTSSEVTAAYKSNLIKGASLVDLTGGFGVDSYYFSQRFSKVISCEIDTDLADIVRYNCKQMDASVTVVAEDGLCYIERLKSKVDWIYIDPSRRSNTKEKVFLLKDCSPNIIAHKAQLFEYTDNILIKVSPLLDISSALSNLNEVKEVHCVAVSNEVKEVLLLLKKDYKGPVLLKTVNIKKEEQVHFEAVFGMASQAHYELPKNYLYEPNAAILKAGLFNQVSDQLKIYKLHKNSHLYTSDQLIDFPGRRFRILYQSNYDAKKIKQLIPEQKAHIATRNFPDSVVKIRKKLKMAEGGHYYLFFTTTVNNKPVALICEKL